MLFLPSIRCALLGLLPLLAMGSLACGGNDAHPTPLPPPSLPSATAPAAAPAGQPEAPPAPAGTTVAIAQPAPAIPVALDLGVASERRAAGDALADGGVYAVVADGAEADVMISDQPLPGASSYVIGAWVAVTDQRRDVLALTHADIAGIVAGEITNWSALGGSDQPIGVDLPVVYADVILQSLGLTAAPTARWLPTAEIVARVQATPGAFALLPLSALEPGLLALEVDGYDPYRDPAIASPIRAERRLRARPGVDPAAVATRLGWPARAPTENPVSLLATGDIVPARCTNTVLEAQGDDSAMFAATRDRIQAADLAVIPLEVGLTDKSPPTPCTRTFLLQGRPAVIDALVEAGVDVVTTAANHAGDCWEGCSWRDVIVETPQRLDAAGLPHTGSGATLREARAPLVIERDGLRFAFLAYDDIAPYFRAGDDRPGTAPLNTATLAADIAAAKQLADHVIVSVHWGVEYVADPVERQRYAAGIAAAAGASLIIGNHPHWVEAVEEIDQILVAYALGNFVFDQNWSTATTQGVILEAGFDRDRLLGYRLRPIVIRDLHRPEPVDSAGEGAPILRRIWDATDRLPARPD